MRIVTKVPDPMLPTRLAAESMNIAPAKGLAEYREKFVTDRFIGTGPFRFVENVVGDRVVLEANPDYWGAKPASQRIVWQVIPDAATRLAALQRGDVDVMLNLPVPLAPTVEGDPSLARVLRAVLAHPRLLLNARESAPLKDRRVRQALNMAVDRAAILKGLYAGRGQFLNTVTGKNVANTIDPGAYPTIRPAPRPSSRRPGYGQGFELTLWQSIGRWVLAEETAQVIAGYWDKIGVRVQVQVLEWAEFNKRAGAVRPQGLLRTTRSSTAPGIASYDRAALQARLPDLPLLRRLRRPAQDDRGVRAHLRRRRSARSSGPRPSRDCTTRRCGSSSGSSTSSSASPGR